MRVSFAIRLVASTKDCLGLLYRGRPESFCGWPFGDLYGAKLFLGVS